MQNEAREQTQTAMSKLLEELDTFPDWMDYIKERFDKGRYGFNGERPDDGRTKSTNTTPIPSYAQWLATRRSRDGRILAAAIGVATQEAFTQEGTSSSNGKMTWRILRGADLSRRR